MEVVSTKDNQKNDRKLSKRKAYHPSAKPTDLYLKRSKKFVVYLKRATKLFNQGVKKITLYALGACILKAVKLALKLEEIYAGIEYQIETYTVNLLDDVKMIKKLPQNDVIKSEESEEDGGEDDDGETQVRKNSAIKIEITKQNFP